MPYFFTSESVSEGHPDKIADQISDALIDNFLAFDPDSKVACETLVTTGQVILAGEVKSKSYLNVVSITRDVIKEIGYTKGEYMFESNSCGILSAIHEQSPDINQGVEKSNKEDQGAGDQGMMFGYATNETENYMPLPIELAHRILRELSNIRKEGKEMTYLRPDAKSQVTIEYGDDNQAKKISAIVISTQHDDFDKDDSKMLNKIKSDVELILIPRVLSTCSESIKSLFSNYELHVNPTGKFVIGGPHGDTGLTGRKIIVDTYGGRGAHGGGAFSGKDPSKVDRSAAYATRHIARNLVSAGICNEVLVQVAYAIGVADPVGLYVNTYGTSKVDLSDGEIAQKLLTLECCNLRLYSIETRFNLRSPIYQETASYGHMGRESLIKKKVFRDTFGNTKELEVELFPWEKDNLVEEFQKVFKIKK